MRDIKKVHLIRLTEKLEERKKGMISSFSALVIRSTQHHSPI